MTPSRAFAVVVAPTALLLGSAAATWASAPARTPIGTTTVTASGLDAAPVLGGICLVVAAAMVASALVGPRVARGLGIVVAAAGAGAVAVVVRALGSLDAVLARQAASATGVAELSGGVAPTFWGPVAAAAAVLLLVGGVVVALRPAAARRSGRYERPQSRPVAGDAADPIETWDALSRGDDPSERTSG